MGYNRKSESRLWVREHEQVIKWFEHRLSILVHDGALQSRDVSSVRVAVLVDHCRSINSNTGLREYDDEKAKPVIEMAERDDVDARAALAEHFKRLVQRNQALPPNMAAHVISDYSGRAPPKRQRKRLRDRDAWLGAIMEEVVESGFSPTASNKKRTTTKPSASMIMLEAYVRVRTNDMPHLTQRAFEKIWQKRVASLKGVDTTRGVGILVGSGGPTEP